MSIKDDLYKEYRNKMRAYRAPMTNTKSGLFIVFEGGEGSGKSTQTELLGTALYEMGIRVCVTKEPGDTLLGAELRRVLLNRDEAPISKKAEALLFAADRAEHVEKVIVPELEKGTVVVCDRYIASTMAYQAHAGGLDDGALESVSNWASSGVTPDITFFLDIPPALGLQRSKQTETNRFEDKDIQYHTRVSEGFHTQIDKTWVVLDATKSTDTIHRQIMEYLFVFCLTNCITVKSEPKSCH